MQLFVYTLKKTKRSINVTSDETISSIKKKIERLEKVVFDDKLRLVFKNNLMADEKPISEYINDDGHVIYMNKLFDLDMATAPLYKITKGRCC